jgi:hypothetical protein
MPALDDTWGAIPERHDLKSVILRRNDKASVLRGATQILYFVHTVPVSFGRTTRRDGVPRGDDS